MFLSHQINSLSVQGSEAASGTIPQLPNRCSCHDIGPRANHTRSAARTLPGRSDTSAGGLFCVLIFSPS
ncbi:hypothetical protein DV515_00015750 [Chloebia gouldiae]|uniref:Uncharacterized protein n=1 Tax=Chloebia gouldiae TaxID=44316 RepID=A0A3L8RUB9_CHLGU|nr:hypothetical protein DV515_00015750 [Chloebia gouldiae]